MHISAHSTFLNTQHWTNEKAQPQANQPISKKHSQTPTNGNESRYLWVPVSQQPLAASHLEHWGEKVFKNGTPGLTNSMHPIRSFESVQGLDWPQLELHQSQACSYSKQHPHVMSLIHTPGQLLKWSRPQFWKSKVMCPIPRLKPAIPCLGAERGH